MPKVKVSTVVWELSQAGLNKFQQQQLRELLHQRELAGCDEEVLYEIAEGFCAGYRLGKEGAEWFAKDRMAKLHQAYINHGAKPLPADWWKEGEE